MADDIVNGVNITDAGDEFETAANITLNTGSVNLITGTTGVSPDFDDIYRFVAPQTGTLVFRLTGLSSDIDLYVYDEDGFTLSYSEHFDAEPEGSVVYVTQGATYFIEVYPWDEEGSDYELRIEYDDSPPRDGANDIVNGVHFSDAGETPNVPTTVTLNANGDALITGSTGYFLDNADWYLVAPPSSGAFRIDLTGYSGDFDLYLYDYETFDLLATSSTENPSESITYSVSAGVAYVIEIDPWEGTSSYTLKLDLAVPGEPAGGTVITVPYLPSQYDYAANHLSGDFGIDIDYLLAGAERVGFGYAFGDVYRVEIALQDLADPDGGAGPEKSPAAELLEKLSDLYIAYFGRAPDAAGLTYWFKEVYTGSLTFDLTARSFSDQPEYQSTYPDGTTNSEFVTSIYQNLFNRAPDQAGLEYWENDLNNGVPRDVFILAVINGAYAPTGGADDRALLINKHDVSLYYAEQSLLDAEEGFDDSIIDVLNQVTSDTATVATAREVIDYAFANDPLTLTGIVEDQALWDSFWG